MDRVQTVLQGNVIESKEITEHSTKDVPNNHQRGPVNPSFVQKSTSRLQDSSPPTLSRNPTNFGKNNEENRMDPLYVSVKLNRPVAAGSNSPLPPALSPASISPAQSSAFNTSSRPSPAPPVIVEEGPASNTSAHPPHLSFSGYQNPTLILPKSYEQRNRANSVTSTSSSSSSSSTSTSTSSSSQRQLRPILPRPPPILRPPSNGLPPVLENMSVSVVLPRITPPAQSVPVEPVPAPPKTNSVAPVAAAVSSPQGVPNEAVEITSVELISSTKKPLVKRPPTKRRKTHKKNKVWSARGDDSDFEIGGKRVSILKRAEETAQKKSAGRKRAGLKSSFCGGAGGGNASELSTHSRYLKSPYFCLCKSQNPPPAEAGDNAAAAAAATSSSSIPLNEPAHVVNPAIANLLDSPVDCPILQHQQQQHQSSNKAAAALNATTSSSSELQAFFASSHYKPTLRPGARQDPRLPEGFSEAPCPSWRCVFCAEPSTSLAMGPLYGPYFLGAAVQSKFGSPSLKLFIKGVSVSPKKKAAKTATAVVGGEGESGPVNRIGREGEVWCHLECVLWAPGTAIHGDGKITGLDDAVTMALETVCSHCKKHGAILSCRNRGCSLCYHFNCAKLAGCHLNEEQFTLLCKKHYVYS